MTHTYLPEFLGACWCRNPAAHHIHTGTWAKCPCSRCQLDRENADLFGWLPTLIKQALHRIEAFSPSAEIPETFRATPQATRSQP